MDDFEQELKLGFLEEASQLLTDAEACYLLLESNPQDAPTLDKIFRVAHNLKGSSKAVGFEDIGVFTHRFETFLLKLKNHELPILGSTISLMLRCNDQIREMVDGLKADLNARFDASALILEIEAAEQGGGECSVQVPEDAVTESFEPTAEDLALLASVADVSAPMTAEPAAPTREEVLAVAEAELAHEVEKKTQESLQVKPMATVSAHPASTQPATAASAKSNAPPQAEESIRVSLARLEKLINSVGELVIYQTVLKEQALGGNPVALRKTVHQMGKVTKEVQEISMSLRMVPLKQTFQKMQRIVRDTAGMLSKKLTLVTLGEETELDKTVLENISDPLVHLIRNACDHGVESPEKRREVGKNETGTVTLNAYHQSGKLVIEVKDDGGGINGEKLLAKAIEKGVIKPGTVMTEQESVNLVFHPGFSTKAQVTEVSGRGVGMDVVKTNIEALQGEVMIETVVGSGTTFKIILPLTLAIIDGMVLKNQEARYVMPLSHVHETLRPQPKDIHKTTGMGEVLLLRGENLPLYRLTSLLGFKDKVVVEPWDGIALVVRTAGKPFAVLVDDIIGQQQVVIKEVGREIQNLSWMSGSAILGDGKPAIILEVGELIKRGKGNAVVQANQSLGRKSA